MGVAPTRQNRPAAFRPAALRPAALRLVALRLAALRLVALRLVALRLAALRLVALRPAALRLVALRLAAVRPMVIRRSASEEPADSFVAVRPQVFNKWKEDRARDAKAVAGLAALARAAAEGRGFVGVVEQVLDRAGERRDVARLDHDAAALEDLGNHRDRRRDDGTTERHRVE